MRSDIETTDMVSTGLAHQSTLAGLPSLLSMLSTYPDPNTVLSALVSGPLGKYRVRGVCLWHVYSAEAHLMAVQGHSSEETAQWQVIPLESQAPVARCISEGQIYTYSPSSYRRTFPTINEVPATDAEVDVYFFGDALRDTENGVNAVVVPIAARGIVHGCYGFMTHGDINWTSGELQALSAYASALALWMSNASILTKAPKVEHPRLTERQLEILQLTLHGHSIHFIAARIGVSLSTVKQEIQRACVALDATTRLDAAARAHAQGLFDA